MESEKIICEIVKLFRKFNLEPPQKDRQKLSRKQWTCKVLNRLGQLRNKKRLGNSKNLEVWSRQKNGEWIWDFCLCRIDNNEDLKSLLVVAESEWGNESDIREDFDKLLVARASVRVMIYDAREKGKKAPEEIAKDLCGRVKKFNGQWGGAYLLIAAAGEKSDFLFFKIEDKGKKPELLESTAKKYVVWKPVSNKKRKPVSKQEISERNHERNQKRFKWWTQLIGHPDVKEHRGLTPIEYSWINCSSGTIRGIGYMYSVRKGDTSAEIYINRGKGKKHETLQVFDQLHAKKEQIEKAFGGKLEWGRGDHKLASEISVTSQGGYGDPEDEWKAVQDDIVEKMNQLIYAVKPHLKKIKIEEEVSS